MRVLVVYECRGGHTRQAAQAIAEAASRAGHPAEVKAMADVSPAEAAEALFVGSWVDGFVLFGVRPARPARAWVEGLPSLTGNCAAVFATYAVNPRGALAELSTMLELAVRGFLPVGHSGAAHQPGASMTSSPRSSRCLHRSRLLPASAVAPPGHAGNFRVPDERNGLAAWAPRGLAGRRDPEEQGAQPNRSGAGTPPRKPRRRVA